MSALIISPFEQDHQYFDPVLTPLFCDARRANNFAEGSRQLNHGGLAVVVCETDLPDGHWHQVQEAAGRLRQPPMLIVTSRLADESLWAEVLHRGGYDVLAKPFDRREVTRVLGLARQHWINRQPNNHERVTLMRSMPSSSSRLKTA